MTSQRYLSSYMFRENNSDPFDVFFHSSHYQSSRHCAPRLNTFAENPPAPHSLLNILIFGCPITVLCLLSWMELTREAYQTIVKNISNKSDLCRLARVSKAFQRAVEYVLYNTIYMRDSQRTMDLCNTLAASGRLASLVNTFTLFIVDGDGGEEDSSENSNRITEEFWESLASALRKVTRLRFLNIHVDGDASQAWILRECTFQLRTFHCDFSWDSYLAGFLNTQMMLRDLYISDYSTNHDTAAQEEGDASTIPSVLTIQQHAMPLLTSFECSFMDAMTCFVQGRPITRVKTCFSREDMPGKKQELDRLAVDLRRSTKRLRSLDLADSSYTEEFSLIILAELAPKLPEVRYLGTLVLPVGLERLQFFGLLMRFRKLLAIELEVSEWEPAPSPQAMRALASELRLYCPSVKCTVFVQDFERTVVRVINGFCTVDQATNADNLWREV